MPGAPRPRNCLSFTAIQVWLRPSASLVESLISAPSSRCFGDGAPLRCTGEFAPVWTAAADAANTRACSLVDPVPDRVSDPKDESLVWLILIVIMII